MNQHDGSKDDSRDHEYSRNSRQFFNHYQRSANDEVGDSQGGRVSAGAEGICRNTAVVGRNNRTVHPPATNG